MMEANPSPEGLNGWAGVLMAIAAVITAAKGLYEAVKKRKERADEETSEKDPGK